VFRHTQLGNLGRIVLQGRPDGRTHVTCEVAGDAGDPMTEKRAARMSFCYRIRNQRLEIRTSLVAVQG